MSIYLDYNATTPIDTEVLDVMVNIYKNVIGNADSRTHDFGENARIVVENARKQVASLIGVSPAEVFFTSGATESNNIAIQGLEGYAKKTGKKHIITSAIEHKSVLETVLAMEKRGFEVDIVKPDLSGRVDLNQIVSLLREDTLLVSLMHVNNETGIIQPVGELGNVLKEKNILFHVDATQSCGKLVNEIRELNYDMLSFSAHKLNGPQGVGVLILKKKAYRLPPVKNILYGGQQEHSIRPGTVPVALVAGCGVACEIAERNYLENNKTTKTLKDCVMSILDKSKIDYHINGDPRFCLDTSINLSLSGVRSEALMIATKQYCGISNGSACTSKSYAPSYVLTAMGVPQEEIENSIRISWGPKTSKHELENNLSQLVEVAKQMLI